MADVRVLLSEGRADRACPNCSTTQENIFRLYWNDTTDSLDVDVICKCQVDGDDGDRYSEENDVGLSAK